MLELPIIVIVGIVFTLISFSAFFSGSETGLTAVSRAKIHKLKNEGDKRAKLVYELRQDKDRLIGTILLGNNLVNIAASALATVVAIQIWGEERGVLYATIVVTLAVLIFAEVLPKTYAFTNAEKVSLVVAPVFWVLVRLLHPFTAMVRFVVVRVLKLMGVKEVDSDILSDTMALRGAIELHHEAGVVVKDDRYMLDSILDLEENDVADIMVHRRDMQMIDVNLPPRDIVSAALDSGYTRLPLWEDDQDNIIGILHTKDILRVMTQQGIDLTTVDIMSILQEPWFVPETTSLKDQLNAFLARKMHFSLVVDEYGDLMGLVTLEDILEEIVGQIQDEHDEPLREDGKIIKGEEENTAIVDGRVSVRDLNREMDWDVPDEIATTVAGVVIHDSKSIPNEGQIFHFHGYRFEVLEKDKNQITKLQVSYLGDEETSVENAEDYTV